ncbi:kinase-like domain-containing protein [Boletus edulis]|nr:kinase-like domain-containing protein [Boletus edulis]
MNWQRISPLTTSASLLNSLLARFMESAAKEENEDVGYRDEDDLGVFKAKDIQLVLRQMNYRVGYILEWHPQLAIIVNEGGDKHRYLKFMGWQHDRGVMVLQYLSKIDSPSNYTISDVQFWPVAGGTVISMPAAGDWLTGLTNPSAKLWSVALQLITAIAFMHEHNNVVIPPTGGRLSIIDFSVSIRVRGPNVMYKGIAGTLGYMAPEVCRGKYKPLLADLWSCGRTLEELCLRCSASAVRTELLELAGRLTHRNPEARPTMSAVLRWVASAQRREENTVFPALWSVELCTSLLPADGLPDFYQH